MPKPASRARVSRWPGGPYLSARVRKGDGVTAFFTRFLCLRAYSIRRLYTTPLIFPAVNCYAFQVCSRRNRHGRSLYRIDDRILCREHRADVFLRRPAEAEMSWIYILSGILALALVIYLIIALLYPEKF